MTIMEVTYGDPQSIPRSEAGKLVVHLPLSVPPDEDGRKKMPVNENGEIVPWCGTPQPFAFVDIVDGTEGEAANFYFCGECIHQHLMKDSNVGMQVLSYLNDHINMMAGGVQSGRSVIQENVEAVYQKATGYGNITTRRIPDEVSDS